MPQRAKRFSGRSTASTRAKRLPPRRVDRRTANQRGYTYAWQRAASRFLSEFPLCSECRREDRIRAATVVDHVKPHRGDPSLFWDARNWQPLCKFHHDRKTGAGQ